MALVPMWPPANGTNKTITFGGRTYSSVPGTAILVQDFDITIMQANGWTTFATVAGQNYIPMTPPASGLFNAIILEGRTYSSTPGVPYNVPSFDAGILQASGWTPISAITLQTLALNTNSFISGATQGTPIGNLLNATSGSAVSIFSQSNANALQVVSIGSNSWQLQVGSSPPIGANSLTVTLREMLNGALNSPNSTGPLGVTEYASGGSGNTFDLSDPTQTGIQFFLKAA